MGKFIIEMIKDLKSQTGDKELIQRLVTTNPIIGGRTEKVELPEPRSQRNKVETNQGIPLQRKPETVRESLSGPRAMKEIHLLLETLTETEKERQMFSCFTPPPNYSTSASTGLSCLEAS